jgi:long-chain acyl-CoA synthetase
MASARGQKNEMTMTSIGVLYELAATHPKRVAFIKDKEIWTYDRLAAEIDHLAYGLVERGLRKGDRVALHMANLPEFVVAYHACSRTGLIAAPLNIRLKTAELIPLLQRLQPTLYIRQQTARSVFPPRLRVSQAGLHSGQ